MEEMEVKKLERQRLEVEKVADRITLVTILATNGYTTKLVDLRVEENGRKKKKTYVEYWRE